jgi:hypothetical protein
MSALVKEASFFFCVFSLAKVVKFVLEQNKTKYSLILDTVSTVPCPFRKSFLRCSFVTIDFALKIIYRL